MPVLEKYNPFADVPYNINWNWHVCKSSIDGTDVSRNGRALFIDLNAFLYTLVLYIRKWANTLLKISSHRVNTPFLQETKQLHCESMSDQRSFKPSKAILLFLKKITKWIGINFHQHKTFLGSKTGDYEAQFG